MDVSTGPVAQLLAAAGLRASPEEIALLADRYPSFRSAIDQLYPPGYSVTEPAFLGPGQSEMLE